jgi:uncharacterized protein YceK
MRNFVAVLVSTLLVSGCMESPGMSNPAMGYSAAEMSQMTGVPTGMLQNEGQCQRSNAILANPGSTANERYGATTAARANGCPGF